MSEIFSTASATTTASLACPSCPSCADSPLSTTANIVGILTFANSLVIGVLLFLSATAKQLVESPEAVRELIAATDAQFNELRDVQAWLESESVALSHRLSTSGDGNVCEKLGRSGTGAGGGGGALEDDDTRRLAVRLLDRAQLCFIASQRYLERYGKIVQQQQEDDGGDNGKGEIDGRRSIRRSGSWRWGTQQIFRRARFVAAREDVVKSMDMRAKALEDLRQFRNRVLDRYVSYKDACTNPKADSPTDRGKMIESLSGHK